MLQPVLRRFPLLLPVFVVETELFLEVVVVTTGVDETFDDGLREINVVVDVDDDNKVVVMKLDASFVDMETKGGDGPKRGEY